LEGAPQSVTSSWRSQIFSYSSLLRLFELWFRSDPRRALCVACGARRTNLYPAGCNPFQGPSCALRGRGLQGGWDHSLPRRLSAMSRPGHTSTLDLISSFSIVFVFRSSPVEDGTSWHQTSFKITP